MSVKSKLTAIADAIRARSGKTFSMSIEEMISIVSSIRPTETVATSGLITRSLKTYVVPSGVTSIGDCAFYSCSSLTSITIPSSITSIGERAFSICSSLTSITIPSSVTSIGERAFYFCTSLTSITIPNSVTSIGDSAFVNCRSLTSITIPSSVTSIGDSAFLGCDSLTDIYCGFAENAVSGAPWGAPNTATIHYNYNA